MRRIKGGEQAKMTLTAALTLLFFLVIAAPSQAAVDHDSVLRDRLDDVRELLDRRQAHRRMLIGKADRLSLDLDQFQLERESALTALADQQDKARSYELQLERLLPRLLPRLSRLDKLRKDGARAIADLATVGRRSDVKDETRSRLLASRPVSIEQMRRASTSVRLLRRIPNKLAARHRDLDFRIPLLADAAERLRLKQDRLQRARDAAIRELAELSVAIERLATEEHRLARNMLARSLTAAGGSATVATDRRPFGKHDLADASIKGAAVLRTQISPKLRPKAGGNTYASSGATQMRTAIPALTADGKASPLTAGWASRGTSTTGQDRQDEIGDDRVAALRPASVDGLQARVRRGRIEGALPLVPTSETISFTLGDAIGRSDLSAIEIPAQPRQPVAAPDDGRVVFAGDFRSYGLLLIIEHGSEYHTLLWGFSSLDIELGDSVRAGQIIGSLGGGRSPKLHVELRRNGQPVSPEVWLAASNSGIKG